MIRNLWYGILDSKEIPVGKPVGVTRFGEKLVLWRNGDGTVSCIFDRCCHRGASLSLGELKDDHVECPFHGFQYDSTGKVVTIPANGKNSPVSEKFRVHSYNVEEKYGFIWLWYGDNIDNLPEIPFFTDLREGYTYGGFAETWAIHYTRAIENQLDVVHLPFVHATTIGKGNKTLVHGPVVEWEDNLMTFYLNNMIDDGKTVPLKPKEITNYKDWFHLQLQMPNIWQNIISDNIRITAIFAPVDDEHTHIYIRFYQKFIKTPVLCQLVNWLSNIYNKKILHQDRRIVITQLPKKSELRMDENLIQGDAPIIEYRKRRALLKGEN